MQQPFMYIHLSLIYEVLVNKSLSLQFSSIAFAASRATFSHATFLSEYKFNMSMSITYTHRLTWTLTVHISSMLDCCSTNMQIKVPDCSLNPTFLGNINASHGANRWPENTNAHFKHQEGREDERLFLNSDKHRNIWNLRRTNSRNVILT